MDRSAIRLELKKALAATRRAPLGRGRTDAAGAYRPTPPSPRWPRGGVSGRLGAKGRGVVPRPWRTTRPACVTDATSQAEAMEQPTVVRGHVTPRRADDMEVLR